jgi:hypothetical protein
VAGATLRAAFAATWRNEQGDVVGTTYGGTMCLWPRKPWRIRITRDGFEHVIRCGECPGCLEFERRRLGERLYHKYVISPPAEATGAATLGRKRRGGSSRLSEPLFLVRIFAPLELHASIAHALHRRRGLELEPGMWRLGATSFALLARVSTPLRALLKRLGLRHRIEPLRLSRGRRAFRNLTAGLLVAREIYGEQRNRFYARGLPKADRLKWEVRKIGQYRSYDKRSSPRAELGSRIVLVPPDVWKLRRADRRSLRGLLTRASDPEGVKRVMDLVAGVLAVGAGTLGSGKIGSQEMRALAAQGLDSGRISGVDRIRSNLSTGSLASRLLIDANALPKTSAGRRHTAASYQVVADRVDARSASTTLPLIQTPSSEEGGYVSSEHEQGELMPLELARAREKEVRDARKRRALKESLEIIERMRRKSKGEE